MVAIYKKKITGNIFACTLILCLTIVVSLLHFQKPAELFSVSFQKGSEIQEIKLWKDEQDRYYLFLPGYVEMADLSVILKTESDIYVNGQKLHSRFPFGDFLLDTPYRIEYAQFGMIHESEIVFIRSGGVASMFLETQSGSIEYIHTDKNNKESGAVSLYADDGTLDYHGAADSIGGRGNYSWEYTDKKPYNIVLNESVNLLNMGEARKWTLLANSADATLMRNKIVTDFADTIGLPYSPESQWVALYLNGEYRGLYLICEAVEIGTSRVDISQTDGIILSMETADVFKTKRDPYFVTEAGTAIGFKSPKTVTEEQNAVLAEKIQSVENALLAQDSMDPMTGKYLNELVDMNSWTKKYLIDEIFGNLDAFMRSAYFYYADGNSELLYAGPVWDYDMSLGNPSDWRLVNPQIFWGNRPAGAEGWGTPWIYSLYQKDEFYYGMTEMYQTVFLPELEQLLNTTVSNYVQKISGAAAMDKIRWSDDTSLTEAIDTLYSYLEQRIEFLNKVWLEEKSYSVVRAYQQNTGFYVYFAVFEGDVLETLPELQNTTTASFLGWYDEKTEEAFDITQPITEDMEIYAKWVDKPSKHLEQLLKLAPLGVIAVIGVGLVYVAVKRMKRSG